jgi:hypothetical protein
MTSPKAITSSLALAFVAGLLPLACNNKQASAQAPATPARGVSAVHVDSVTCTAVVTAIDHEKRTATLRLPSGAEKSFEAGKELVNFDQVKVGDHLKVTFAESLAVQTRSPQSPSDTKAPTGEATVALAPKGSMPAGVVAGTVEVTAKVVDIDQKARLATLSADGRSRTIHVGPNIDLSKVKAGDEVVFRYTRGVLLHVDRPSGSEAEQASAKQPGAVAVETTIADATISSLDKDQRTITLKRPDGSEQLYKAAKTVDNFDQLKAGDDVRVALAEALAIGVRKAGGATESEPSSVVLMAGDSSTDAVTVYTVQETSKVEAVDLEDRVVTLKKADGQTHIVHVGPQVNLTGLAPGDDVVLRLTSGVVVKVEK